MEVKTIAIIGGGFCGLTTALQLKKQATTPLNIKLINGGSPIAGGVAYSPESERLILNVPAGKMSAFPDLPDHFLNWLHQRHPYRNIDSELLSKMFVSRKEYGIYLKDLYNNLISTRGICEVQVIEDIAVEIGFNDNIYTISCRKSGHITAHRVVLATGNELPGNPKMADDQLFNSPFYFKNPWDNNAVNAVKPDTDVLIIGNGLTMVDTVLGLVENGFNGTIYSLSPNGFNILPHRHGGITYNELLKELDEKVTINDLFALFHKHTKLLRNFGLSAEPIVDSIRPFSQKIWMQLSLTEKKRFLQHIRHLWGVARHRLPIHIYDLIQQMRIEGKLIILKGNLLSSVITSEDAIVTYYDRKKHCEKTLQLSRVINCTGPSLDISKTTNPLLKTMFEKGMIRPDPLHLGLDTNAKGAVINQDGMAADSLFTLGGSLRGLLWESTAVPELRVQAQQLAALLCSTFEGK